MVQMLSRTLKPLGRPKQPRPTAKLQNTTIRDFGGGLNVVDSEQSLTSKFAPVFDNMITYTDRRVGPRYGYEMWLNLRQGIERSGTAVITLTTQTTAPKEQVVKVTWTGHGIDPLVPAKDYNHVTFSGWDIPTSGGVNPEMVNRTHGIRRVIDANNFEIVLSNRATGVVALTDTVSYVLDGHALGGEPIECKYFANHVILWTSNGEIIAINKDKDVTRLWSQEVTFARPDNPVAWTHTELVASDIFGTELICSNGREKPVRIDFTQPDWVVPLYDPEGTPDNGNLFIPAFDACKSAFRYFTVHDSDPLSDITDIQDRLTSIRISSKNSAIVYSGSGGEINDAVDIDMSKIVPSPEVTVCGFATIKDAVLVITPSSTTMMKYDLRKDVEDPSTPGETIDTHDPQPVDTLNGFGTNSPRTIVEIGSDVFMVDFNGVPSAKLSALSNAIMPERVSNYIESMMSAHIGRLTKEIMRKKAFGFYDGKNKNVHFYLPKYDENYVFDLVNDPLYFDSDMGNNEFTKRTMIMRIDDHQFEADDVVDVVGATGFGSVPQEHINGRRVIRSVLSKNYVLISIGDDLPNLPPSVNVGGGGNVIQVTPVNNGSVGYIYHYVPQLKLTSWSRFTTSRSDARNVLKFNCGCGTIEGRSFLFTPDGYMMRYGSPDHLVHADWLNMWDFSTWVKSKQYVTNDRVLDGTEGKEGIVYKCLADVDLSIVNVPTVTTFAQARAIEPDKWEEYRGENINFAWELPWADFGARQLIKSLRFTHLDAVGTAKFTASIFADNIYQDAATGQLTPARTLTFVPNDAGAYGVGAQVYGAGRRTREQKIWQMPVRFKILKTRIEGSSVEPLSISGISFLYQRGSVVRG